MIKTKKFNPLWIKNCEYTKFTSISIWNKYLLANKINSNTIEIFDINSGDYIKDILNNDIGIFEIKNADDNLIINNLLFRIDSFLGICQIYDLKLNKPIGIFGFKNLDLPKCITGFYENNEYSIYILDVNNHNILKYNINIKDDRIIDVKHYNFLMI